MTELRNILATTLVGPTALAFSASYLADVIEALQGRFSGDQLG